MRDKILTQLNSLNSIVLFLLIVLTPLIFLNRTTEFFEMPKLIFLATGVLIMLVIKGLTWVAHGKVTVTRTPLDLPLILLLAVIVLSTFFSPVRDVSLMGNLPRIHGSAISWIVYLLFYLLLTSSLKGISQIRTLLLGLLTSGGIIALISLLSYFGVYLPFDFAKFVNFTPTGSSFSTLALLIVLLPVALASIIQPTKVVSSTIATVLASLYLLVIALIGDLPIYIVTLVSFYLFYLAHRSAVKSQLSKSILSPIFIPIIVGVLAVGLGYLPLGKVNPVHTQYQNFPHELQLPFDQSWKVAASSFRDAPFLGSGPATYLFDFTLYKGTDYNTTNLWNIRFDSAYNEFLQLFATLGILGLLGLIFLSVIILNFGWKGLKSDQPIVSALSASSVLIVALLLIHTSTTVTIAVSLALLAALMALNRSTDKVEELSIGIKAARLTDSNLVTGDALPLILLIPILIVVGFSLFNGSKIVLADYHHRLALDAAATRGLDTYNELVQAENLNPRVDLYRTDLAQTNFALANSIAASKGPTQASPAGSLTDADKQNIQTLLSQAINEGRAAVTLNPLNVQNWEILASIYRQISGVAQNALQFSLASYGQAISRDPLNPLLRLNIGGVYYSVKNYDLAVRFFTDSVNLKPDFANGYYNLAVALKDKGDYVDAASAAQQAVNLVGAKSPDYDTANKLYNELKDLATKQASGSAQQATPATPPAAQQTSALQQQELPKVVNLPQPEEVATPSAIKK